MPPRQGGQLFSTSAVSIAILSSNARDWTRTAPQCHIAPALQSDAILAGATRRPTNTPIMTSMLPRFAAWLGVIALILLLGRPAAAAAVKPSAGWQAVLAAGDNAQPVFDNAVDTIARRLAPHGVPSTNIHRLSASYPYRGPAAEPSSGDRLLTRIAGLPARPGQRCLVFITSHGRQDEGVWLAHDREYLEPGELAQALSAGCARVPTVVVVSACY